VDALDKWLNLLEGYFYVHNFLDREKINFTLLKDLPHVKHWWETVNSNLVQYLLQTDIQKRTEKIQWQIQTLHRDFSPGNPNRENQHILY
jgi:hypothetical protein